MFSAVEPSAEPEAPTIGATKASRLSLMPWPKAPERSESATPHEAAAPKAKPARRFRVDPLAVAASAAAIGFVAVSMFAAYDHVRAHALVAGKGLEAQELSKSIAALKTRIDTIETARSQEQTVELKKTLTEIKAAAAIAQGANASLAQLGQRVDKIDKEQNARLDKLTERVDQSIAKLDQASSNRNADLVARLDRLEKRPVTVAVAQAPASPAPSPKAVAPPTPPSPPAGFSNDVTGSIEKPKPVMRGYTLAEVHGGVAYIESREGGYSVTPGDVVPGMGRILRIERRGASWVVVTSQGLITAAADTAY